MSVESIFPSIPAHWRAITLGELAKSSGGGIQTGPFGSQLHAEDYVDDGIPSIMPKNISIDSILTDDIARVSPEDVERLSKYKVKTGDIVYSRRGDVEKCARVTSKEDGWLCGTGCLRVRVLPGEISTEYLHAYLCHPSVREWIVRHAIGATMPNLNTSILNALPVVVPSKAEMATISSVWLNISDKIQLNHQINQTLEQIAQALFKSWFVDFEPVKAKIASKARWQASQSGNESASPVCYADELEPQANSLDLETTMTLAAMQVISGAAQGCANAAGGTTPGAAKDQDQLAKLQAEQPEQYAQLKATAALFPAAMQESEWGEIPEGWRTGNLSSEIDVLNGFAFKSDDYVKTPGVFVLRTRNFDSNGFVERFDDDVFLPKEFLESHKNYLCQPFDYHLVMVGASVGKRSIIFRCDLPALRNQNMWCFRPKYQSASGRAFVKYMLDGLVQKNLGLASGSAREFFRKGDFQNQKVCFADDTVQSEFQKIVLPILTLQSENIAGTRTLSHLRDTLLPKLLSGELTLPEAEQQAQEASGV